MVNYPLLSEQQQQYLPTLKQAAKQLPVLFEDSTHQLWQCDTIDGPMVLKVCNVEGVRKSTFWQGMNSLFNADFPASLQYIEIISQQIAAISPLAIPDYIAVEANSFVLATWLEGEAVASENVSDSMVIQLAEHLARCHQQTQTSWGPFHQPNLSARQWPSHLHNTIELLADNHPETIPSDIVNNALQQAKTLQTDVFVPIMLDLRWDQFLQQDNQLSALVDLDAIVYGPRELELVLLEYLLNEKQAKLFEQNYNHVIDREGLAEVREVYRLLLFLMNVLGKQDIKQWMSAPIRF